MAEISAQERQWRLLMSLCSRGTGRTLRDMAEEMQVTQKTIHRDLLLLRRIGFPLQETVSEFGRKHWRIVDQSARPPLAFTLTEVVSLYVGRRFLEPLAGTNFWDGACSAFRKIHSLLSDTAVKYLDKWTGAFHLTLAGAGDYSRKAEIIDRLMIGIEDHCVTCLTYQSERSTEPITRDVHPYGLIHHHGALYLVAFAPEHQQVRHYKIDRVEQVDVTTLKFPKPSQFDLAQHLSGSFGIHHADRPPVPVVVRFAPQVARYVSERRAHHSQKLFPQPDGSLRAEYELSDLTELQSWLLSFGSRATVLEPESLRTSIAEEIQRMCTLYPPQGRTPHAKPRFSRKASGKSPGDSSF